MNYCITDVDQEPGMVGMGRGGVCVSNDTVVSTGRIAW